MKFRRRSAEASGPEETDSAPTGDEPGAGPSTPAGESGERALGPWDESEKEVVPGTPNQVDLGSLVVTLQPGLDLQLQVDERGGQVVAALLAGADGAVELRAFAAPRNGDIWERIRADLTAEVTRRGGTAQEASGPWGPELRVVMQVTTTDGTTGTQPSRVFGIAGPRWLLRATMFGRPALEPSGSGLVEQALRDVVVRRGPAPFAPGEALPLRMPPGATPRPPA